MSRTRRSLTAHIFRARRATEEHAVSTLAPPRISALTQNHPNSPPKWENPHTQVGFAKDKINEADCRFCGTKRFRFSSFRCGDIQELLRFRFPVRCVRCYHRTYRFVFTAVLARYQKTGINGAGHLEDTWRAWTGSRLRYDPLLKPVSSWESQTVRLPVGQNAMQEADFLRNEVSKPNRYIQ